MFGVFFFVCFVLFFTHLKIKVQSHLSVWMFSSQKGSVFQPEERQTWYVGDNSNVSVRRWRRYDRWLPKKTRKYAQLHRQFRLESVCDGQCYCTRPQGKFESYEEWNRECEDPTLCVSFCVYMSQDILSFELIWKLILCFFFFFKVHLWLHSDEKVVEILFQIFNSFSSSHEQILRSFDVCGSRKEQ